MLNIEMLNTIDKLKVSHEDTINFMDSIVTDIEVLTFVLTNRRDFIKEEALVDAIEAGNLIKKARKEISNDT